MILTNLKIVLPTHIIPNGYLRIEDGHIAEIGQGAYTGIEPAEDKDGLVAFPGFIDIHIHGSVGIDFMDAKEEDYPVIADSLYGEGVTTFLATTLTSDKESLSRVCATVANVIDKVPSLGGIHFEGPYISLKYKGAQNPEFIRDPDIAEFDDLQKVAKGNIRYIAMAPERPGAMGFIEHVTKEGVVVSAGHTDASFACVEEAIRHGLTNTTHTHNAMSPHHHRNPGVVTAAMYFDELFTEVICDTIHVCPDTLKTFYKIVGPDRFVAITDALKVKHADIKEFQLFGLDCVVKPDAAYLTAGPLAGSLLSMDQGLRNLAEITKADDVALAKMMSTNAARSIGFTDRGTLEEGKLADVVLLDETLHVKEVYKLGKRVK
ncbi:MAG: N-acetylglucosamine-6-phosphate deacetylase [Bacilli bacterium]|nr:N-acetylglucosamine-6-phosphate deacetylase [Bacilli bacterium]